jgi:ornithine--oxo-acid transaminase
MAVPPGLSSQLEASEPDFDIASLFSTREAERYSLHSQFMNETMVRVLRTIGYDIGFCRGRGQYLFDRAGERYLDLLSGWGVFGIGRNHPRLRQALTSVLACELPNLVQMDVSPLAGILAERLLHHLPYMDKVCFTNSGAEAVETAMKFARKATGRAGIVYCTHGFHGLSYGALSLNGDQVFRDGFGPLLPDCVQIPFNDLEALERALAGRRIAAFVVEPIQGKGVNLPDDGYLAGARELCRREGTLFIADEIQTGLGRTGRFLAVEHWDVEPDMVLISKTLSGGHVPVGAVLARRGILEKVFDSMERAVVHNLTFAANDLAMAAGIATLEVLESERLVQNALRLGARLLAAFEAMAPHFEMIKTVRGKGLFIGIEFGPPRSLKLRPGWELIEAISSGLFCQLICIPLLKDHRVLVQVAGHASHTVKLLPALVLNDEDCDWIERSFETVIADSHRLPGGIWTLGKTLAAGTRKAMAHRSSYSRETNHHSS